MVFMGTRLAAQGHHADAEMWLRRAAATGDDNAKRTLVTYLKETGRYRAAADVWVPEAGHNPRAAWRRINILLEGHDLEEANRVAVQALEASLLQPQNLPATNDPHETEHRNRYGIEPGGTTATAWAFPLPQSTVTSTLPSQPPAGT